MIAIVIALVVALRLVQFFRFLNKPHNPPVFGIYQQQNKYYWPKYLCMYVLLRIKQLVAISKRRLAVELGHSGDGTIHVYKEEAALEQKFYLEDSPNAVDAVYFNGLSKDGTAVICGVARRPQNICDAFIYIKVEGQDLLLSPSLPDTYLKQSSTDESGYKVQGIEIVNFMPMRTWKLTYTGDMKPRNNPEKTVKVDAELTWSASCSPFNYDWQISPRCVADAMAKESWSLEYFQLVKKLHQTHYEQMGFLKGTVTVDGTPHTINMPCVRDHSFGLFRDWRTFHRYVYHFIFLENGDCMAVGSVSQPTMMSHVTIGYMCRSSDQSVFPVKACDFKLYQHGEGQVLPNDYGFVFEADNQLYAVKVEVRDETVFYIGKERPAKFYERWANVEVNGLKGWACVEWQYNNVIPK